MTDHRVCPASHARALEGRFRRLIHPPRRVLDAYISPGDTVMDIGCGTGYFTRPMARAVGGTGTVIAIDLQEEMLRILRDRAQREGLLSRITIRQAAPHTLGLSGAPGIDFALAFFVVHEVPDIPGLFDEVAAHLVPGGRMLVVEPSFHVRPAEFEETVGHARNAGLSVVSRPRVLLGRAVLFEKQRENP